MAFIIGAYLILNYKKVHCVDYIFPRNCVLFMAFIIRAYFVSNTKSARLY